MQVEITTVDATGAPVSGVAVAIYDSTSTYVTGAVSNAGGLATFDLASSPSPGILYKVYLFKVGIKYDDPFDIFVTDAAPLSATFQGSLVHPFGVPTDPYLCRCVGRFLDYRNRPRAKMSVRIATSVDLLNKVPKIVGGSFIASSAMEFRTNPSGYVVADLLRGGEYFIAFAGEEDEVWGFKVPDLPTANLTDLVHPRPVAITYSDIVANAVALSVGETRSYPISLSFTDHIERPEEVSRWAEFMISDPAVMDVTFDAGLQTISIRGVAVGVATLTVSTKANFPVTVPVTTITAPTITVTVS